MIHELKNITPFINFGFGRVQEAAAINQPVTVWLATLYNQEAYTFVLSAPGATVTKVSNYEYEVAYAEAGSYQVSLNVVNIEKSASLASNILNLTIT
jgi:hypothetical protein